MKLIIKKLNDGKAEVDLYLPHQDPITATFDNIDHAHMFSGTVVRLQDPVRQLVDALKRSNNLFKEILFLKKFPQKEWNTDYKLELLQKGNTDLLKKIRSVTNKQIYVYQKINQRVDLNDEITLTTQESLLDVSKKED